MTTSSYDNDETSSGTVKIINDILDDLENYDVLVVDDIIDTGTTMKFVMDHAASLGTKTSNPVFFWTSLREE